MYRVFLIDDEPWAMVSLEHLIDWQNLGFEIAGKIDNARTAWEQIQREQPDVIITDIRMPGLSGLELLSLVHESALPIEVVLVSAFADFTYAQEAISKGAAEYLLKPVRRDKLTACISLLAQRLQQRGLQRNLADATRRTILAHAATPQEAWESLTCAPAPQSPLTVLHCAPETDALLSDQPPFSSWPRVLLGNGEAIYLTPCLPQDYPGALTQCGLPGAWGAACIPQASMENLVWLAKCARLTARFVGKAGLCAPVQSTDFPQEIDLFKAVQYNQKAMVLTLLDQLRAELESGRMLLDKLFNLLSSLNSFCRHMQDRSGLLPDAWRQYSDLLQDYPSCDALFAHLHAAFSGESEEALLTPVLQEIETHYAQIRTLAALGQELGVSQAHLSQLIRKHTGKTYSELVQDRRMEKAKELLAYSEAAVMDIAVEVGYSDQFYFSKLFKRLWGLSPAAWRKKVRSGNEITKSEMK